MGAFMALVTFLIASYYSVVLGWCAYYFVITCAHPLPGSLAESTADWEQLQSSAWPVVCHLLAVVASAMSVCKGVSTIEPVACVSITILLAIVVFCFYWAIFLPHASKGIVHIFTPSWGSFKSSSLWLDALSQNAWDTGGGIGTFLTYATYMKRSQGAVKMGVLTPAFNNVVSIVCGIMVFSNVFSVLSQHHYDNTASPVDLLKQSGPASTGITFLWMPILFSGISGGRFLAAIFFLCLTLAGLSSLISFVELLVHTLTDFGLRRIPATILVAVTMFVMGVASALDLDVLVNQDSVWGYAMILCGCLLVFLVLRLNPFKFRRQFYNEYGVGDWSLPLVWVFIIMLIAPIEGVGMIVWWIVEEVYTKPGTWWQLSRDSLAMVLTQWSIVALVVLALNWFMKPLSVGPPRNVKLRKLIGFFVRYEEPVRCDGVEEREQGKDPEEVEEEAGKEEQTQDGTSHISLATLATQNTPIVTVHSVNESEV
eukprot:Em0005g1609a